MKLKITIYKNYYKNTTRRRLSGSSETPSTSRHVTMAKEHAWMPWKSRGEKYRTKWKRRSEQQTDGESIVEK